MSSRAGSSPPMNVHRKSLVDFFSRALSSFQGSSSKFQVICTVPGQSTRHGNDQLLAPIPPHTRPKTLIVLDSSFNPPTIAHLRMATSALRDVTEANGGNSLGTARLLLLLAVNNADKAPKPAPFDQRLALMWAFAKDIRDSISEQEVGQVKLEHPSNQDEGGLNIDVALSKQPYFHEKSAAIAQSDFYSIPQTDKSEDMEQVILAGYDTLIRILNPKYYGPPTPAAQVITSDKTTPIQKALGPFFSRARLRITLRTDDEWGGKEDQLAYLQGIATGDGLRKIGGSKEWGERIDMVEGRKVSEDIVSSTYARDAAKCRNWERLGKMVSPDVRAWIEAEGLYAE